MKIESKKSMINAPIEEVFSFLVNTENIGQLLPKNEVKDFKGNLTECSFKVQGGIMISLIQKELISNKEIRMVSGEKSPFPFELNILLEPSAEKTEGRILFSGEVNSFLQMMVRKPLTNLFNHMTNELQQIFK